MKTLATKSFLKSAWNIEEHIGNIMFITKSHKYVWYISSYNIHVYQLQKLISFNKMAWIFETSLASNSLNRDEVFKIVKEHYHFNYK